MRAPVVTPSPSEERNGTVDAVTLSVERFGLSLIELEEGLGRRD